MNYRSFVLTLNCILLLSQQSQMFVFFLMQAVGQVHYQLQLEPLKALPKYVLINVFA